MASLPNEYFTLGDSAQSYCFFRLMSHSMSE
jgi:hypothetical protein